MNATCTLYISIVQCTEDLELVKGGGGLTFALYKFYIMGLPVS